MVKYTPPGEFAAVFIIYSQLGLSYAAFHATATKVTKVVKPEGLLVIRQSPTDPTVPADALEWDPAHSYVDGYNLSFWGEPFATPMFSQQGQRNLLASLGFEVVYDTLDVFQPDNSESV